MRVALTGATGLTGRFVAAALKRAGATPVALKADLTDGDAINDAMARIEFDRVIHLAAHAFVHASDWQAFYAVNQLGTFNLLDALSRRKEGARCIIASSAQIYGPKAQGLITEAAPANPSNHYAVSKFAMEQGAQLWGDQLDIVVTRPFNYTGVGQESKYLVPKIVEHFRRRTDVIELGNTWVRRDFGDVRSVADAYVGLVLAPSALPVVNIATGKVFSIDDIIERLTALSGHHIEIRINPDFVRKNDVEVLGGDPSLLRSALPNWKPRDIEDTLEWMYVAEA